MHLEIGQVINLPGTPPPPPVYLFADEFDGPAGSPPDPAKWSYILGAQFDENPGAVGTYTDSTSNCYQDGNSNLIIRAKADLTSARLATLGKFSHMYGSWGARIKFSKTAGCWPSWWCMGSDPSAYPACGEVDIFEVYGNAWASDTTVWTPAGNEMTNSKSVSVPASGDGNWHIWRMDWAKGAGFKFFQDGVEYFSVAPDELPNWLYDNGNRST